MKNLRNHNNNNYFLNTKVINNLHILTIGIFVCVVVYFDVRTRDSNNINQEYIDLRSNEFIIGLSCFTFLSLITIFNKKETTYKLYNLVNNQNFLISLCVSIALLIYIYKIPLKDKKNKKKIKDVTNSAIVAFIIAILAYLDLTIAPFWVIWITSYYLNIDS